MSESIEARRERIRKHTAKLRLDPEYRARQTAWNKAWRAKKGRTPEVLARKRADQARYRNTEGLAERHRVRDQTRKAIAKGDLVRQPCEVCGEAKVDAHHDDYSKPFEVRWLCRAHHAEWHVEERLRLKAAAQHRPSKGEGAAVASDDMCDDCPPVGYPTDKTRCLPCPRRASNGSPTHDQ